MKVIVATVTLVFAGLVQAVGADGPIPIVAAENFYGGIAALVGGDRVAVTSVLNNPDQDPHLFEASPSVARNLADARIVIANGAEYDPWVGKLIEANPVAGRTIISAGELVGAKPGDNPHLWYLPGTMRAVGAAVAARLAEIDPSHREEYAARLTALEASLKRVSDRAAAIRAKYAGAPVAATEPVFGYMAETIGLDMKETSFQVAVMNDTEPSARDVAAFEDDLANRRVRVLFYNSQVTDPQTDRLLTIAKAGGVPVVGVAETQPAGKTFVEWMLGQLDATDKALSGPSS